MFVGHPLRWQINIKRGALARFSISCNKTFMVFNNSLTNGQCDTGAVIITPAV